MLSSCKAGDPANIHIIFLKLKATVSETKEWSATCHGRCICQKTVWNQWGKWSPFKAVQEKGFNAGNSVLGFGRARKQGRVRDIATSPKAGDLGSTGDFTCRQEAFQNWIHNEAQTRKMYYPQQQKGRNIWIPLSISFQLNNRAPHWENLCRTCAIGRNLQNTVIHTKGRFGHRHFSYVNIIGMVTL